MIAGRIIFHKEPERYRPPKQTAGWSRYNETYGYQDDEIASAHSWMREAYLNQRRNVKTEQELLTILNKATCDGLVEGARVKRSSGNPGIGTVVKILRDTKEALDEDLMEFVPFRVQWDATPSWPAGGTFNYPPEELVLISSPIELPQGNKNETVPNLSLLD